MAGCFPPSIFVMVAIYEIGVAISPGSIQSIVSRGSIGDNEVESCVVEGEGDALI